MKILLSPFVGILVCLPIINCSQSNPLQHTDSHTTAMTHWSDRFEFFSEFTQSEENSIINAIVHITLLDDFLPLNEGTLSMSFENPTNHKTEHITGFELIQAGIFKTEFPLEAGHYHAVYHFESNGTKYHVNASDLTVGEPRHSSSQVHEDHSSQTHEDHSVHPHDDHSGHSHGTVEEEAYEQESKPSLRFLKEQQWKQSFATEVASQGQVFESIKAYGQVLPKAGNEMLITSPLDGVIISEIWPVAGATVQKQEIIFYIIPAISQDKSLAALKSKVKNLELEVKINQPRIEQLRILHEKGSVSRWEFEDAVANLDMLQTQLITAKRDQKTARSFRNKENNEGEQVKVRAPFSGAIVHVKVTPQQFVSAGTELVHIVKPTPVYLDLSLSLKQNHKLSNDIHGLYLRTSAHQEPYFFSKEKVRFLSITPGANPETGKLSSLFELNLEHLTLPFNSAIEAEVLLIPSGSGIVVPHTALVDDSGRDVIYTQESGESFLRKEIRVIRRQGTRVLINGISEGERIVTLGGNTLRRIELIGTGTFQGHGHEH